MYLKTGKHCPHHTPISNRNQSNNKTLTEMYGLSFDQISFTIITIIYNTHINVKLKS